MKKITIKLIILINDEKLTFFFSIPDYQYYTWSRLLSNFSSSFNFEFWTGTGTGTIQSDMNLSPYKIMDLSNWRSSINNDAAGNLAENFFNNRSSHFIDHNMIWNEIIPYILNHLPYTVPFIVIFIYQVMPVLYKSLLSLIDKSIAVGKNITSYIETFNITSYIKTFNLAPFITIFIYQVMPILSKSSLSLIYKLITVGKNSYIKTSNSGLTLNRKSIKTFFSNLKNEKNEWLLRYTRPHNTNIIVYPVSRNRMLPRINRFDWSLGQLREDGSWVRRDSNNQIIAIIPGQTVAHLRARENVFDMEHQVIPLNNRLFREIRNLEEQVRTHGITLGDDRSHLGIRVPDNIDRRTSDLIRFRIETIDNEIRRLMLQIVNLLHRANELETIYEGWYPPIMSIEHSRFRSAENILIGMNYLNTPFHI